MSTQSEVLDEFRQMCDDEGITTWYDFENNIKELSLNLYQKAIMGDEAPEVYDAQIAVLMIFSKSSTVCLLII